MDQEIVRAVDMLSPEYRTVLLLWAMEGLSYKEIAEVCDCAIGTVMSRLHRARQALSSRLARYAQERNFPPAQARPA
jgi:RNA polymerase sigma-70 factor (ECF subfamily)